MGRMTVGSAGGREKCRIDTERGVTDRLMAQRASGLVEGREKVGEQVVSGGKEEGGREGAERAHEVKWWWTPQQREEGGGSWEDAVVGLGGRRGT